MLEFKLAVVGDGNAVMQRNISSWILFECQTDKTTNTARGMNT